jgi:hypothetical protein
MSRNHADTEKRVMQGKAFLVGAEVVDNPPFARIPGNTTLE